MMKKLITSLNEARIGWIGTGIMGAPMAGHLVRAGYKVSVYNRTREKADALISEGCPWYDSPAAVAGNSDIIFTIVGFPSDVEEVYFGENGILKKTGPDTVVIDMTTTLPELAKRIDHASREKGAHSVDAPVSGGEVGAVKGTLSVMIGGEREVVEAVVPIMEHFSSNMVYQGEAGAGQHTKMCNQIVIAGTMIGVCEALIYGAKAGLDLTTVLNSIGKGAAGCWTLDVLAPKVIDGNFEPGFMVEHYVKDLGIALKEADNMNLNLPGTKLAKELYDRVMEKGLGTKGTQALYLVLKEMAG